MSPAAAALAATFEAAAVAAQEAEMALRQLVETPEARTTTSTSPCLLKATISRGSLAGRNVFATPWAAHGWRPPGPSYLLGNVTARTALLAVSQPI